MQRLDVSGAVQPIYGSLGVTGLNMLVGWPGQLSRYSDYSIGYTVRCSKPCGGEIFRMNSDPPTYPPTPLYRAINWLENDADPPQTTV